jgi:hypothetical protein
MGERRIEMKRGDKVIVLPNKKIGIIDKVEDGFFFLEGSNRPYMRGQLDYHDLNKAVKPILKDMNIYDEALEIFNGTDTDRKQEEQLAINNLFDVVREDCVLLLTEEENDLVNKALERAKKEHELLGLYRSVHGVVQSWDTMPNVQKQIDDLEKELEEMK